MIRIALVGLGHIGKTHAQALERTPGFELVAGCDWDPVCAQILPERCLFFDSHEELFTAGGFDTVVVATPNATHGAIAKEALLSGYHVIVEKPATVSMQEFDDLTALAEKNGLNLYFAFHAASGREVRALETHFDKAPETYGPVTAFHCRFFDPYINSSGYLVDHAKSLGDCWTDSAVNALSVLDRFVELDTLQTGSRRQSGGRTESLEFDSVRMSYQFAVSEGNGAGLGLVETGWDQGLSYKATTLYFGQTGWVIHADHSEQSVARRNPSGDSALLATFEGDRLFNHYLGVFDDYRTLVESSQPMNGLSARRIHAKFFEGIESP